MISVIIVGVVSFQIGDRVGIVITGWDAASAGWTQSLGDRLWLGWGQVGGGAVSGQGSSKGSHRHWRHSSYYAITLRPKSSVGFRTLPPSSVAALCRLDGLVAEHHHRATLL